MKNFVFILLLILSSHCLALEVQFVGPCSKKPLYSISVTATEVTNVGSLSLLVLKNANIPFQGTEKGLNQIFNSPVGLDAMEVVSDQEMMAYGWCFEVDGIIPEAYADKVSLESVQVIKWFFGYAHYLNGEWVAQCLKSHARRSPFICGSTL